MTMRIVGSVGILGRMTMLAGKVALVTGAGSGVGRAVALRFVDAGVSVLGFDINAEAVTQVAGQRTGQFLPVVGDVRDRAALTAAADRAAEEFGGLDIL